LKSSKEELQKRGFAEEEEIALLAGKSQEELLLLLQEHNPVLRTSAAVNLMLTQENEMILSRHLLNQLSAEKCLYTKLAICEALQRGGVPTARQMVPYLGRIGSNQYKDIPDRVSLKKSYPLPRDIIARTLAKMPKTVFPVLLEVLQGNETDKICEVLDAIGFMVFYNRQLSNEINLRIIYDVLERFKENELLQWKAILCLSGFVLEENRMGLKAYAGRDNLLGQEALRALALLDKHIE
jgi:hypothetical protein